MVEQILSVGALCQNILNGAYALGFYSQWITEWPAYNYKVKNLLGHDSDINLIGFIFIGSTLITPVERKRAEISDVVSKWRGTGVNTQ